MTDSRSNQRLKLWIRLGTTSVAGLAAASMTLAADADAIGGLDSSLHTGSSYQIAQGGEGGEGGEGGATPDPATDDAAFLTLLGLVEGHLRAGMELYRQNAADMAKTHMKHPSDELYAELKPALEARGIEGFAKPLEQLAVTVEGGEPVDEADRAFEAVLQGIDSTRAAADGDLAAKLGSVVNLVRTAADEYEIGVQEGKISDPHEYQDAWGFVQAAKAQMVSLAEAEKERLGQGFDEITADLDGLGEAWPAVVPPESVSTDASLLHAAAARIELAAMAVK